MGASSGVAKAEPLEITGKWAVHLAALDLGLDSK